MKLRERAQNTYKHLIVISLPVPLSSFPVEHTAKPIGNDQMFSNNIYTIVEKIYYIYNLDLLFHQVHS